jgi:hypothetical protein
MAMRQYLQFRSRFAALLLLATLVAGCAWNKQSPDAAPLNSGTGRLILYREAGKAAATMAPTIRLSGHELGKLYAKTCIATALAPGDYELRSEGNFLNWPGPAKVMRVTLQPDAVRYVELFVFDDRASTVNHTYADRTEGEAQLALAAIGSCMEKRP